MDYFSFMRSAFNTLFQSQHANIPRHIKRIIQQTNDKNIIIIINKYLNSLACNREGQPERRGLKAMRNNYMLQFRA
jgi:hypothetical protein